MTSLYIGPSAWPVLRDANGVEYTPPPEIFYIAYRGSQSHGTYLPSSEKDSVDDIDLMGFVFGSKEHYFGLSEWGSRGTKEVKVGAWDVVLYEVRKAVSLLLQGNPNIMSMLWVGGESVLHASSASQWLIENRHLFVGKHVYNAFSGYAHQQLEKITSRDPYELREYLAVTAELKCRGAHPQHKGEHFPEPDRSSGEAKNCANWMVEKLKARLTHYQKKGENIGYLGEKRKQLVLKVGYDAKNASHLIRLLRMSIEFMQIGNMIVKRPDADELIDIKTGKWTLEQVKQLADELFIKAKEARDASTLPDEPDRKCAEKLLVELVSEHLNG